jgi:ketosteroid isomerase-like protein
MQRSAMNENPNVRAVRQIYDSIGNGDVESVLEALRNDVEWRLPAMNGVPQAGTWRGHDGVRRFFGEVAQVLEIVEFRPDEFIAQGDRVVALGRFHVRVNSTGWDAASEWAHVWDLQDGKVARFMEYLDTAMVSRAHAGSRSHV